MRLFVAVNLPNGVKKRLEELLDKLRTYNAPIRWVEPESLHITLKFLGEVPDPAPIAAALERAVHGIQGFEMQIERFGAFPSLNRAHVFWIGVEAPDELRQLQNNVEREITPLGYPREAREFSPHLTLGRVKGDAKISREAVDRIARDVGYKSIVRVQSVELMRSRLSPLGARYEAIHSVEF